MGILEVQEENSGYQEVLWIPGGAGGKGRYPEVQE